MKTGIRFVFTSLVLLYVMNSSAQIDLTNNGILYVSGGSDIIYINGNFTNASGAALTNNGSLYVRQNLTNDQASVAIGTGTLYLNGTAAQSVNGSQQFRTYNLQTDNTAGFTLNNDLSVSNVHTFTNGLIASSATPNYLVYQAGSSYAGNTDARHVTGWVKKIGTTDFTFPVGDNTYQRTVAVTNLSASSEFNCRYYTPTYNIFNLFPPLVRVHSGEYWQVDRVSGGTAQMALNWDHSKVAFMNVLLADVRSAYYTAGNWTNVGGTATGNVTTTGNITSNTVNAFGSFTFGSVSFPLPLSVSLQAIRNNGVSNLKWITGNELNVDHFEIERSIDAVSFRSIGRAAAVNSGRQEEHTYNDAGALQGIAYYRIRAVNINGQSTYSRIAAVSEKDFTSNNFTVLNPVKNAITIFNRTGREGNFSYRLMNAGGQLITTGIINMAASGSGVIPVQVAAGVYVLEVADTKTTFRQKLIIER